MNCVTLELKNSDGTIYKVDENIESSQLIINDDVISNICKKMKIKTLSQLSLKLGVNNMALIIKDYTLTDIVYIEEFYDIKSYISIFQTKDTNVHITGQILSGQSACILAMPQDMWCNRRISWTSSMTWQTVSGKVSRHLPE